MQRFTPAVSGRLLLSIGCPKAALPLTARSGRKQCPTLSFRIDFGAPDMTKMGTQISGKFPSNSVVDI